LVSGGAPSYPRVIFVMPFPPTVDFRQKFFVCELERAGIRTEYWDISDVMGYRMRYISDRDDLTYREFPSLRHLGLAIAETDAKCTAFVVQITRGVESFRVYRLFSHLRRTITYFGRGYIPTPRPERSVGALLAKLFAATGPRAVLLSILSRALRGRLPMTPPYDLVFTAGEAARRHHLNDAVAIAQIHHFDLDAAHKGVAVPASIPERYIVFIDDYLPFHPDFSALGSRTIEPQAYYKALNEFFGKVETESGLPVVIAAHPKGVYETNRFGGRALQSGATNSLVEHATLVLAHASTAISFAVIFRKPVWLLYTSEIVAVHPYLYKSMVMTAKMLGCPIMDLERAEVALLDRSHVDVRKYAAYYRMYVSAADPTASSAATVVREFERIVKARAARLGAGTEVPRQPD
jgi:hypothetical protein